MGNFLDAFLEPFRDVADVFYFVTRFIWDPMADVWKSMLDVPVLGDILGFFEDTFAGRSAAV